VEVDGGGGYGPEDTGAPWQTVRYLKVRNETGEELRVSVQTPEDQEPRVWTFNPGEAAYLAAGGQRLTASQVWIWAESGSRAWRQYQEEALTVVDEPYQSDGLGTHTHTFQ
jgi:hypothetical protein